MSECGGKTTEHARVRTTAVAHHETADPAHNS
jgi:hypothetical protein